ncbi:caspase family protein [Rhizobium johnstonii]|nr:caspase family protein [Rhizobium johnstonii]
MSDIRAFIVGVARYQLAWTADSAARNACALAVCLFDLGVASHRIHLFVDADALSEPELTQLSDRGIVLNSTVSSRVDDFWRTELLDLLGPQDRLLVYWSGHGITDNRQERLFFCSDYSERKPNGLFNSSQFLAHLKSDGFARCRQQLFLADVCGNYSDLPVAPATDFPPNLNAVDQLTVYASKDGAYTSTREHGVFTSLIIRILESDAGVLNDSDTFINTLKELAQKMDQKPFWIRWRSGDKDEAQLLAGKVNDYVRDIRRLLAPHQVAGRPLLHPFQKTTRQLRLVPAEAPVELAGMLQCLASFDDDRDAGVPAPLLQFLTRLSEAKATEEACRRDINAWIKHNSTAQSQAEIATLLRNESKTLHLLIEAFADASGGFSRAEAELTEADGWPVTGFEKCRHSRDPQLPLEDWIAKLAAQATEIDDEALLEVHIFVDPPLLHVPFHKALLEKETQIGERFDCYLHYRARVRNKAMAQPQFWKEWYAALRNTPPNQTELIEILSENAPLHSRQGLCFASFAHGPTTSTPAQTQRLARLLNLGAPYVFWRLDGASTQSSSLKEALREVLKMSAVLEHVPSNIRKRRLDSCEVSADLAILWDDPSQHLLSEIHGVS